ncbi:MAG: hypothetical protein JNL01_11830 [Bdellovibrionales bacterium]|nr:hypothetical protein [Bdellovibrionales bacterium]
MFQKTSPVLLLAAAALSLGSLAQAFERQPAARKSGSSSVHWDRRTDTFFFVGPRYLNQTGLSDRDGTVDALTVIGHKIRATTGNWEFEARPEFRSMLGNSVGLSASDPARLSIQPPEGFLPLRFALSEGRPWENYLSLERIYARYHKGGFQVQAGRSVVSLGVLKVFPIWNRFSRPLPTAWGPSSLIYGRDNVSAKIQLGDFSFQGLALQGKDQGQYPEHARHLEMTWYAASAGLELHLLAGQWWNIPTFGFAVAQDISGVTVRTEGLIFENHLHLGFGLEKAINEKWTLLAEGAFLSDNTDDYEKYRFQNDKPYQILRALGYGYLSMRYKWSDDWFVSGSTTFNVADLSQYLGVRVEYTLNENLELAASLFGPVGFYDAEFSAESFVFPGKRTIGAPLQSSLEMRYFF